MAKLGGFQSGFHARCVPRREAKWPEYLICSHDCPEIIQLISHVSGEVEFELCAIEAGRMAKVLLEQVGMIAVDTRRLEALERLVEAAKSWRHLRFDGHNAFFSDVPIHQIMQRVQEIERRLDDIVAAVDAIEAMERGDDGQAR